MAAQLTDVGLQRALEYVLGLTAETPTGAWLTLFTTGPSHNGVGDVELTGYARAALTVFTESGTWPNWSAVYNATVQVPMPACTVTGWGLSNASTGGDLLVFSALVTPVTFQVGDRYTVTPGTITLNVAT